MSDSIAIRGRWALIPDGDTLRVEDDVTVVVRGGRIAAITQGDVRDVDRQITVDQGIILPGFINLHNHSLNGPTLRGVIDDTDRRSTQGSLIYRLLMPLGDLAARELTHDELRAIYTHAMIEILKSGTTTILDSWRPAHEVFFDVARDIGIRAFGAPYIMSARPDGVDETGMPRYVEDIAEAALGNFRTLRRRYEGAADDRLRVVLSPHGVDTCSAELLRAVRAEADATGALITIHAAQSKAEIELIQSRYGMTPIELLRDTGVVGPDVMVAHGVFATDSDLEILRETDTTLVSCPLTFGRGGITAAFGRFHGAGIRTVVGTDGYSFDFLAELRAAGLVSKLDVKMSHVATSRELIEAATRVGADALRRPDLGRIEVGATADITVVSLASSSIQPVLDPLKSTIWYASAADIALTMVAGRLLVENGKMLHLDEPTIVRASVDAVHRLWALARENGIDVDSTPQMKQRAT